MYFSRLLQPTILVIIVSSTYNLPHRAPFLVVVLHYHTQGERRHRLQGDEYYQVVEEVCTAIVQVWPDALLQFEDFETTRAFELLGRRRQRQLCFNDDIQGTGAVVTAGVINGLRLQETRPGDARIVFFGAGSSAVGVAEAVAAYLEHEEEVSREEARSVRTSE
jgi:malic enzyme